MAMVSGPDGGPMIPVKVQPSDFHDVAQRFVDASGVLYQALSTLFRVLQGFRGPAGVDNSAKQLDAVYRPAVDAVVTGVNRAVNLLGDIGLGIDVSARNHWNADAAANPTGSQPPPWPAVDAGLVLPQDLAVPSLVGSPTAVLPPPLSDKIPMGHIDDLGTVATAFTTARDTIDDISVSLHNALEFLFSNNQSADLDALDDFWNRIGGSADTAILTALRNACGQLASAVDDYATWTVDTQNQILDAVGDFLKNATLGAIVGILLGMISDGIGTIAAIAKIADDFGEGGALVIAIDGAIALADGRLAAIGATAGGIGAAMTASINGTPDPSIASTSPQSVTDASEQADAAQLGDKASPIDGMTPEEYVDARTALQADAPKDTPISNQAADEMLQGPPGTVPDVAGPNTTGADILFKDPDGQVVLRREIKTTSMNPNSFSSEMSSLPKVQLKGGGEAWFQVPEGSTSDDAYDLMRQFQQNRLGNEASNPGALDKFLAKYNGIDVTFVNQDGDVIGTFDATRVLPPR